MKLATLADGSRDGRLAVVSRDLRRAAPAQSVAPTLQAALDDWAKAETALRLLAQDLAHAVIPKDRFHERQADAPLPRDAAVVVRIEALEGEAGGAAQVQILTKHECRLDRLP